MSVYLFLPVVICEHERLTISCPPEKIIHVLEAYYGRQNRETCPSSDEYTSNTNCHAGNSHAIVGFICGYKPSCELWAHNSVFGDWCEGTFKYLIVRYQCVDLFVLCENTPNGTLSCSEGQMHKTIRLLQASYGRHDRTTCQASDVYMTNTNCHSENTHAIVKGKCHDKPSCELYAHNSVFGDPCPGTYKYLRVMYECIDVFVLCQSTMGILSCPEGKTIKLVQASYGRHDRIFCKAPDYLMTNTSCHSEISHLFVEAKCVGETSCELFASNIFFGDPCPGTSKYLMIRHECI